jgi:hypothetical protein
MVDNYNTALSNRAHCEFWLEGQAELSHYDHIERCLECASHFKCHRHTAAW